MWKIKMEKDISIIIPSCNFELLQLCIASVIAYTDFNRVRAEFIIVANGLPQPAKKWLDQLPLD